MIPVYTQLFVIFIPKKEMQPQSHSSMKRIYLKIFKK